MAFVPPGVSSSREALDAQNLYSLQSGSLAPLKLTLTVIKELSVAKDYIYTRWLEALLQLDAYLPLLASLIDFNRPVVVSYQKGLREFCKNSVAIEAALSNRHGPEIGEICLFTTFTFT